METLFRTDRSAFFNTVVRVVLAIVFFAHGSQKMLGWFGGSGFSKTVHYFTTQGHLPMIAAVLVVLAEFFGSIGLFFGFLTRIAALGICGVMIGAIAMVHAPNGFFMNWTGHQGGEGFEYHLLVLAMAAPLFVWGAGALSVDGAIYERLLRRRGAFRRRATV